MLIELLLEFLLSGLFDLAAELLFHGLGLPRGCRARAGPVSVAAVVVLLLLVGGATGGAVTWLLPSRLFATPTLPGASLIVSPLLNGALMHYYGAWKARGGKNTSPAATFWGGAAFGLGFAIVRLLMLQSPNLP